METILYKNEFVTYPGGTARVKSIYANGFVTLTQYNKDEPPKAGDVIVGVDSKNTITLSNQFEIDEKYSFYREFEITYPPTEALAVYANEESPDGVGGPWVVLDAFYSGLPSQNCQTEYFILVK